MKIRIESFPGPLGKRPGSLLRGRAACYRTAREMVKAVCFYLPQFHPIKENDEWWGKGFTEWTNVAKARPNFEGHYQPHVPTELGYYDLRDPSVQRKQAELAGTYGIYGFCYYYYWFNGRQVLERPLEQLLEHPEIDFPFCVCWANENWTRTWDGRANDMLLQQNHGPEDDEAFLRNLLKYFRDPRYIRVNGRPMLLVYRVNLFPDARKTAARWRAIAESEGFDGLHLCAVQFYGIDDPEPFGFDAAVEFPPHKYIGGENNPDKVPVFTNLKFAGALLDYQKVVSQAIKRPRPNYLFYRGVIPSWDNTPRRQDTPHIIVNSSPLDYQYWLRFAAEQTRKLPAEHQWMFINAWNEWGEGCYLEPDTQHGRAYLEATRSALSGLSSIDEKLAEIRKMANGYDSLVSEIADAFDARERSLYALQDAIRRKNAKIEQLSRQGLNGLLRSAKAHLNRYPRVKRALKALLRRST